MALHARVNWRVCNEKIVKINCPICYSRIRFNACTMLYYRVFYARPAIPLSGEYPAYSPVKHTQVSTTLTLYSNIRKLYHADFFKLAPRERMPVNAGKFYEALNAHSACNLYVFRPYACMSEWRVFVARPFAR